MWAPNRQPWVKLECGHIDLDWGTFETCGVRWKSGPLKGKRIRTLICWTCDTRQRVIGPARLSDLLDNVGIAEGESRPGNSSTLAPDTLF